MESSTAYKIGFFSAISGALASSLLPTIADAYAFRLAKKDRDKWSDGEITPERYWRNVMIRNYLLGTGYWLAVGGIAYLASKGNYKNASKFGLVILGAGAVGAVVFKCVKEDKSSKKIEINKKKTELAEEYEGNFLNDNVKLIKEE